MRSDSVRNRAAIIEAATAEFTARGQGADVREIASRAEVALGTLYRHFPTKDELLETVMQDLFTTWQNTALTGWMNHPDPWEALTGFIDDAVCRQAMHVALTERLARPFSERQLDECARRLAAVAEHLVARCHRAGLLREGVVGEDIIQFVICLASLADHSTIPVITTTPAGQAFPPRPTATPWARQRQIGLDGLRPAHGVLTPTRTRHQDHSNSHT
ncbi:TetR/AcrR family transcriptional regulator [Parafrankia sp. BMG5.11]|uniref:TetR/AcrR family transcriptional regulator n=1 Tax=Parafrankia sp. BMG5.11 TaxID=222540 RepID=UPI001A9D73D9|nr:TetR/AcrR family transcriptional regulator [Parafrankia sp. BMG5.11]